MDTLQPGWLECNGAALSKTVYKELYAVLKDGGGSCIYGESGGNFNIPDLRGIFVRCWDNSAGIDPDAASRTDRGDGNGGDIVGSYQTDAFIRHYHNYDGEQPPSTYNWFIAGGYPFNQNWAPGSNTGRIRLSQTNISTKMLNLSNTVISDPDANRRVASETTILNINVMFCIKYI